MKINRSFIALLILISSISITALFAKPVMGEGHGIFQDIISKLEAEIQELESALIRHGLSVGEVAWTEEISAGREIVNTQNPNQADDQRITASNIGTVQNVRETVPHNVKCTQISRNLRFGNYEQEVKKAQEFLQAMGHFSHPHITPYFGPVTEKAVQEFQAARGIVSGGTAATTGFGQLGPRTRKAIEDISCQIEGFGSDR